MGSINKYSVRETNNIALGQMDKDIIDDTSAHTGNWAAIFALADTTFSTLTDSTIKSGTMAGKTLYAGYLYLGDITAITLSSGTVIAYGG